MNQPGRSVARGWKLTPAVAARTQGLVVSAFGGLPVAEALFVTVPPRCGGAWLRALRERVTITDATGRTPSAAAIAFTWSGLDAMGLDADALASFSTPFREGMHQADRRRRLGDDPAAGTVVEGGPRWSGNISPAATPTAESAQPRASAPIVTPCTAHALLVLYEADEPALAATAAAVEALLQANGVRISHRLPLSLRLDERGIAREHFGFADGVSQPVPYGDAIIPPSGPGAEAQRQWHGVPAGEILLGHPNAHGEPAPGPVVADTRPGASILPAEGVPEGFRNLGRDGTYLVVRELHQDVAAFWHSMQRAAGTLGGPVTDEWIAARAVGRTRDGELLRPAGAAEPTAATGTNDVGFAAQDVHGFGCPLGSHIRRGNPRDSLPSRDGPDPSLKDAGGLLQATNAHRLLRRGRKFGPVIEDCRADDRAVRGLLFMCLNTDLVRHFEFVQQTWMLNHAFATLFGETDPVLGPKGPFTIPATPLRLRPRIETFVRFAGGEYFFLPSLPALDYLAGLMAPAER